MWTDFITNRQAVERLYSEPPSLAHVELFSIELDRDGPSVRLKIGIDEFPANPSPRWRRIEANAVALELLLIGVEAVSIQGWSTVNPVGVHMERIGSELLRVAVAGPTCDLSCCCACIRVGSISPYLDDPSRENA